MRLFILLFISWTITGCALQETAPTQVGPRQRVYYSAFDNVWRSTQIALQDYPIKINNIDRGVLETEIIKGYDVWTPPHKPNAKSGGFRYKLVIRVIKGRTRGRDAIKVTIFKRMSVQRDFFSPEKSLSSDGLEEESILYRIQRELKIDRALKRAQKYGN
jgi:hypothetical protein